MEKYIILFFLYSIFGWFLEIIYMFIIEHILINRGFLYGPYCPIYGIGGVVLYILLDKYKNNLILLIVSIFIICSVIEYIISYILEKIFKLRWWDYSKRKFNINGRICLETSIYFTIFGVLIVKYINPLLIMIINKIPNNLINIFTIIIIFIISIDIFFSISVIRKLKKTKHFKNKDVTNELNKEKTKLKE